MVRMAILLFLKTIIIAKVTIINNRTFVAADIIIKILDNVINAFLVEAEMKEVLLEEVIIRRL